VRNMSRYKKILTGEKELKSMQIDDEDIQFIIYPTMETHLEMLNIYKDAQKQEIIKDKEGNEKTVKGDMDLNRMINVCSNMVYEGCFNHDDNGKRLQLKEEEKDVTLVDIKYNVIKVVFELFMTIATELGILSKEAKQEIEKKVKEIKNQKGESS